MSKRSLLLASAFLIALSWTALAAQPTSAKDLTITLGPGDTARIPLKLWCLDFGKPFPKAITGPTTRAPDSVVKVLQTAIAKGTIQSDPYQTQVAIWRATSGTLNDPAKEGTTAAQQIYSDSLAATVTPLPTGVGTLDTLAGQGGVKVTVENFTAISDTKHAATQAYNGTADLVVQNTSSAAVTFVMVEGAVFKPTGGTNDQTLISHQDTSKQTVLPTTGGELPGMNILFMWIILGLGLIVTGLRVLKPQTPARVPLPVIRNRKEKLAPGK